MVSLYFFWRCTISLDIPNQNQMENLRFDDGPIGDSLLTSSPDHELISLDARAYIEGIKNYGSHTGFGLPLFISGNG